MYEFIKEIRQMTEHINDTTAKHLVHGYDRNGCGYSAIGIVKDGEIIEIDPLTFISDERNIHPTPCMYCKNEPTICRSDDGYYIECRTCNRSTEEIFTPAMIEGAVYYWNEVNKKYNMTGARSLVSPGGSYGDYEHVQAQIHAAGLDMPVRLRNR